jgi:hypothetical protein
MVALSPTQKGRSPLGQTRQAVRNASHPLATISLIASPALPPAAFAG